MVKQVEQCNPGDAAELATTLEHISETLTYLASSGLRGFDGGADHLETLKSWGRPPAVAGDNLAEIQREVRSCDRCSLSETRKHTVFGEGADEARLVFVGEGPGYEEDQRGRPFVGPAGRLLTKIIQAMGLAREDVYICNIIKCRPPGNRNPDPGEIRACLPFLKRQLAIIRPDYICALGAVAARTLLKSEVPISRMRGRLYPMGNARIMPTYHPAYLLRNPDRKRDVWEDVQILMREMGL
ncbi:MAG: uracil-DNA glycosylase [Deltaproteobacteria bacterium]|jgi:uracil-DNA glycosylase|nr:uracil-DNA glycosylase [Deltaproteobacteria bacterium]